jgi:hypothetical protein
MTSSDEGSRRHRENDDIEFFATLPSDVDPTKPQEVDSWLNALAQALTDKQHVHVVEETPPADAAAAPEDPGVWFGVRVNNRPICPGKILEDGDEDDDGGPDDDEDGDSA